MAYLMQFVLRPTLRIRWRATTLGQQFRKYSAASCKCKAFTIFLPIGQAKTQCLVVCMVLHTSLHIHTISAIALLIAWSYGRRVLCKSVPDAEAVKKSHVLTSHTPDLCAIDRLPEVQKKCRIINSRRRGRGRYENAGLMLRLCSQP